MLKTLERQLENRIIELLSLRRGLTAGELHRRLIQSRKISLQGVYHELRRLQREGVVVKYGKTYGVSISWILEVQQLTEKLYKEYVREASPADILPEAGQRRQWKFSDLRRLDDFWMQAIFVVFEATDEIMYEWSAHPWYFFAHTEKVDQFYRGLLARKRKFYKILGHEGYLDRLYAQRMNPQIFEFSFAPSPFADRQSEALLVCGEYLITIKLDPASTKRIDRLFSEVRSAAQFQYQKVFEVVTQAGEFKLIIERHPKKASRLRRQFEEYFFVK